MACEDRIVVSRLDSRRDIGMTNREARPGGGCAASGPAPDAA